MPVTYILPNLEKIIALYKKQFGEFNKQKIWHFVHERVKDSTAVGA
jgi:hypothetical protein